jgi:glyceraldehyde-3-phosphate dehydrogenase/erythrose-4-phosphate dehydrogenase
LHVYSCQNKDLEKYIQADDKHAILSAPAKVVGVNDLSSNPSAIFSTASCTRNCVAPVEEIMALHTSMDPLYYGSATHVKLSGKF